LGAVGGGYRPRLPLPRVWVNRRERSSSELSLRPALAASYRFLFVSQGKFDELRGRLAEISDLVKTSALLGWDMHVMMPVRGASIRAEQMATIGRIAHEKFTSAEMGSLIDSLGSWGEQQDYDSFEASLVRVAARDWEKSSKVPGDLRAEMSRSAALANQV